MHVHGRFGAPRGAPFKRGGQYAYACFSSVSVQFLYSFCHTFRPDIKREVPASGLVCLPCLLLPPAWRSPIVRLCRLCRAPLSAFD